MSAAMTDEQRKALIVDYLRSSENGGRTVTGGSMFDLFAEDAQVGFPKWGLAVGKEQIGRLFTEVGGAMTAIHHHFEDFRFVFSGSDVVVVEGSSEGRHNNGAWDRDSPVWGAGRFVNVFEIRDFLIQRCFVYLDPDYAGQDVARYPWLGIGRLDEEPAAKGRDESAAVRQVLSRYAASLNSSDADAAVACYTDDGVFMAPGIPTARGTSALKSTYESIFRTISLDVTFDVDEVVIANPALAYALTRSHGRQTTLATGQVDEELNREVFILRKQSGDWRFARYLFNQPR